MSDEWPTTKDMRDCISALRRYAGPSANPRIICSRETADKLALLTDEHGRFIWCPETGLLWDIPVIVDEDCEDIRLYIRWD